MSTPGSQRLSVRLNQNTEADQRFLRRYLQILNPAAGKAAGRHAAGVFMRDCLLRGFALLESEAARRVDGQPTMTTVSNTHETDNKIVSTNDSYARPQGGPEDAAPAQVEPGDSGSEGEVGSGVRRLVSRLGLVAQGESK